MEIKVLGFKGNIDSVSKTLDKINSLKNSDDEIIQHDKPKDIIWKVKKELPINHHAFITKCPNYNRLKEKGLVIEVKNLDYSSLKKENLDKIIEVVNNQL